jgi:hypothetical protein
MDVDIVRGPYSAYTEEAEFYEVDQVDLDEVLPPFTAGLLAVAGRFFGLLAYRDALECGDRALKRRGVADAHRVLALLPRECDRLGRQFRLSFARGFDDLVADLVAGRAPLPRCGGERQALELMIDHAPHLLGASDDQLRQWGVAVPRVDNERDYQAPLWEPVWEQFMIRDVEYSIAEARSHPAHDTCGEDSDENAGEVDPPAPPADGWSAPRFWFSPYGITAPRNPVRGHPPWVSAALTGARVAEGGVSSPGPVEFDEAARLLGLSDRVDPWQAYTSEFRGHLEYRCLAEVLTPPGAALLIAAAEQLLEQGYEEVLTLGEQPFHRPPESDDDSGDDASFLALLPPCCDDLSAPWRLAMVRAVADLVEDLRAGRAPLPRCSAEEIALLLDELEELEELAELDDEYYAGERGLQPRSAFTARHLMFGLMREVFFQDDDFLMLYEHQMAGVAADPDHLGMRQLTVGDLRPPSWWATFANLRPRPAGREFAPWFTDQLTQTPALRFATEPAHPSGSSAPAAGGPSDEKYTTPGAVRVSAELTVAYEHLVGLAQHRFFDESLAIAMARALAELFAAFLDTPDISAHRVWSLGQRATAGDELLLPDTDFCIDGLAQIWRFHADQTDAQARSWVLGMLTDCTDKILHSYHHGCPELPFALTQTPPPQLDAALPVTLADRAADLATVTTTAAFLLHRRTDLGLHLPQVARAAILPASVIAGWEAGAQPPPSQLLRCAPVLQLEEHVLLETTAGVRNRGYWPLPKVPRARLERTDPR